MDRELLRSVILIRSTDKDKTDIGTGFVVHQDAVGAFLVTCTHVLDPLGDWQSNSMLGHPKGESLIKAADLTAQVVAFAPSEGADIAVLRVEGLLGRTPFEVWAGGNEGDRCESRGYEACEVKLPANREGRAEVNKLIKPRLGGVKSTFMLYTPLDSAQIPYIQLRADEYSFQPGHSGGPLLHAESQRVIGVIRVRGEITDTNFSFTGGYAVGIEAICDVWTDMPSRIKVALGIGERGPAANSQPDTSERAPEIEYLLRLCDRITPTGRFKTIYEEMRDLNPDTARSQAHIHFIGGIDQDEHEDFVTRLVEHELPKLPVLCGKDRGTPLFGKVAWPIEDIQGGMRVERLEGRFKESILRLFVPPKKLALLENDPADLKRVIDAGLAPWVKDHPLVIASLEIPFQFWGNDSSHLLRKFVDYWATQRSPNTIFLAFVSLVYPPEGRGLARLRERFALGGGMRQSPKQLISRRNDVFFSQIPELGPVQRFEAERWLKDRGVFRESMERTQEIARIYGDQTAIRMRPLRKKLRDTWNAEEKRKQGP